MARAKQFDFFTPSELAYGSSLMRRRKGRKKGGRPLTTKDTMHLVIRSTKARGAWSFRRRENAALIRKYLQRFAEKHFVKVFKVANVGNHLHLHIRIKKRLGYKPFIRAFTSAIAVGISRINEAPKAHDSMAQEVRLAESGSSGGSPIEHRIESDGFTNAARTRLKFFDLRPFTRVIKNMRAILTLRDYLRINELEGAGFHRGNARLIVAWESRWRGA